MKYGLTLFAIAATLAVTACGPREVSTSQPAPATSGAELPADPSPKFIGAPTPTVQTAGDAILPNTSLRDVTYVVHSDVHVEVFVTSTQSPAHVTLLDGHGNVLAEADAPVGQEVSLTGVPSEGEPHNVIRIARADSSLGVAAFSIRIRTF